MTTLSFERVETLTETVENLSRSAQLSISLAHFANNKNLEGVLTAAAQDSFLQTVLALPYKGKVEKKFPSWLSSCFQHEAFVVFAEADLVPLLQKLWRWHYHLPIPRLATLLEVEVNDTYSEDLRRIAEIAYAMPTINKQGLGVLLEVVLEKETSCTKDHSLIFPRAVLFMELAQDLWFDYGVEVSIEHFLPSWLSLSEGRTAAIERVVFRLLRYNNAISNPNFRQILHVLTLVTLSIKDMQIALFKQSGSKEGLWLTSNELEKLLERFILDENFLLLTSKINVLDFEDARAEYGIRRTITHLFLHWVNSHSLVFINRLIGDNLYYNNITYNFRFTFEQLVKYLPPFALVCSDRSAYALDWDRNIRTVFPELTQKAAHIFSNHAYVHLDYIGRQDNDYSYYIWCAKVENLGGNAQLALALYQFRNNNFFDDGAFWDSVIRFCVANEPALEHFFQNQPNTYSNLFGYLSHKRQEERDRFEMKGRSLRVIMQQTQEWYAQIYRNPWGHYNYPNLSWTGAAYQPYELEQSGSVYTITQLTTNAALQLESNALHHCVSGYGANCANGSCSIWSLRVSIEGCKPKSLVTLQIDNNHHIIQAKTTCNAHPNTAHLGLIKEWAAREGIVFVRC